MKFLYRAMVVLEDASVVIPPLKGLAATDCESTEFAVNEAAPWELKSLEHTIDEFNWAEAISVDELMLVSSEAECDWSATLDPYVATKKVPG
jgi:hypothetical protein